MRRTKISIKGTYELAKSFLQSKGFGRKVCKRGCPPTYDTALILTLMVVQNLYSFSFRETLEFCREIFGKVPALSSYHERISSMPKELIVEFTEFLGAKLIKKNGKVS